LLCCGGWQAVVHATLSGADGDGPVDLDTLKRRLTLLSSKFVKERRVALSMAGQLEAVQEQCHALQRQVEDLSRQHVDCSRHRKKLAMAKARHTPAPTARSPAMPRAIAMLQPPHSA
jgi:hypothetical protein